MKIFTFLLTLVLLAGCAKDESKPAPVTPESQFGAAGVYEVDWQHGLIIDSNGDGIVYPKSLDVELRVVMLDNRAWQGVIKYKRPDWRENCSFYIANIQDLIAVKQYHQYMGNYETLAKVRKSIDEIAFTLGGGQTSFKYLFETDQEAKEVYADNKKNLPAVRSVRALTQTDLLGIRRQVYSSDSATNLLFPNAFRGDIHLSFLPAYAFCDLTTGYLKIFERIKQDVYVELIIHESEMSVQPN